MAFKMLKNRLKTGFGLWHHIYMKCLQDTTYNIQHTW